LTDSLGLLLDEDGTIRDVIHGMLAYNSGIGPEMRIQAVNGRGWSLDAMRRAVADSEKNPHPIKLLIANGDFLETYTLDYHDGIRYPHLARKNGGGNYLDEIIQPLTPAGSQTVSAQEKPGAVRTRR
jgi:hypothetical protein